MVGPATLARLRAAGPQAAVGQAHGGTSLFLPGSAPPRRVLDFDGAGHVTTAIRRGPAGELVEAWMRAPDGGWVGVQPGGATHPLWGASDRIVRRSETGPPRVVTVAGAVAWDAIAGIPPLAEPARLPPGAGTTILNLLAALAADQGAGSLRYRGPYATEQLFWALCESFRFDRRVADPLGAFLGDAESAFVAAAPREAPLDWTPAPHERRFADGGLHVQLRDGVEKVWWQGRAYYRTEWQGLARREHRVVRPAGAGFVAGLQALGRLIDEHVVLDARGEPVAMRAPAPEAGADVPLDGRWREALAALLPLEATPLLATAIAAVWPGVEVVWGGVPGDLVETRDHRVRLARALVRAYARERATADPAARRGLAQRLVREVLGLLGPPVRQAAAAWLEVKPPARQAALLDAAARQDRTALAATAAAAVGQLVEVLLAGDGLPLVDS